MARTVAGTRQLAGSRSTTYSRQGFPQNYTINAGTLFEDFENISDWTLSGTGAALVVDTTNFKSGTQSLKLSSTNAVYGVITKTINSTVFSQARTFTFWIYIHDSTKLNQSGTTSLYISSTTDISKYFSWTFNISRFRNGWNKVIINKSEFSNTGSENWDNTMVRIRFRFVSLSGQTASVSLDKFVINEYNRPKVILTFDDGRISQYDEAYTYMQTKDMTGVLFLSGENLDTTGSYVTTSNVNTMYSNGWDISTHGGVDLTTLSTVSEMESEMTLNQNVLINNGWTRNSCHKHYAYPNGAYNDTSDTAFNNLGFFTGRTILTDTPHGLTGIPVDNYVRLKCGYITNATTLATVEARVDSAIKHGQTLILVFHSLVASPSVSTEWAISDFQSLIDYIYTKKTASLLDVVTISEWYNGLTNPRVEA